MKYDNCKILDKQGKHIFNCDGDKANWYLREGHGEKVCDEPLTVRFTFDFSQDAQQAKFEGYEELYKPEFYLHLRENVCAVCSGTPEGKL